LYKYSNINKMWREAIVIYNIILFKPSIMSMCQCQLNSQYIIMCVLFSKLFNIVMAVICYDNINNVLSMVSTSVKSYSSISLLSNHLMCNVYVSYHVLHVLLFMCINSTCDIDIQCMSNDYPSNIQWRIQWRKHCPAMLF